ncbi:uncharacterized protein LOC144202907 isoform X2 [Stigmatopora nigra]
MMSSFTLCLRNDVLSLQGCEMKLTAHLHCLNRRYSTPVPSWRLSELPPTWLRLSGITRLYRHHSRRNSRNAHDSEFGRRLSRSQLKLLGAHRPHIPAFTGLYSFIYTSRVPDAALSKL